MRAFGDALLIRMEGARVCKRSVCEARAADRLTGVLDTLILTHSPKSRHRELRETAANHLS